ncbi:MAG: NAD(+) synthase [Gemmatales bacterium]|nr:NAD(+) synthase [Gemmatales bacterium]MDW7994898.1 NAD(+) synthase [Gemmatales bacterium]
MWNYGFVRVAAAVPRVYVADCQANLNQILQWLAHAQQAQADLVVFPELAITGYTCADLFHTQSLLTNAEQTIADLAHRSAQIFTGLILVGAPVPVQGAVYNCVLVLCQGKILGCVPKTYLPTYKEFYEARWFASARQASVEEIRYAGQVTPMGTNLIFRCQDFPSWQTFVEVCEDFWVPVPPSSLAALAGATVLVNASASNEVIGKADWRRQLVLSQSGRCIAGYIYVSCGPGESSTDLVYGGHALVAENGHLLVESERFQPAGCLVITDLDIERLILERQRTTSFGFGNLVFSPPCRWRVIDFRFGAQCPGQQRRLLRQVDGQPFVPRDTSRLAERCREIFSIQVTGLAQRLENIGNPPLVIGVSGGLDSTLALLVCCRTVDRLQLPRTHVHAFTLPGFGTTQRTLQNAQALMRELGVRSTCIDIRRLCFKELQALGHRPFGIDIGNKTFEQFLEELRRVPRECRQDLVFENVQARMRMNLLMNAGFVVGTGDLSELALGWCTYGGDHMSMYNPNVSIPKTLVRFLVEWVAQNEFSGIARQILLDIVATTISPELLPVSDDESWVQATEETIGPYELHDFFLYYFLRFGFGPRKIYFLARHAEFSRKYTEQELHHWLGVFLRRFFANQYKRSCLPDGPKVGTVSLSPRGDWRMPSDAQLSAWLVEWQALTPN